MRARALSIVLPLLLVMTTAAAGAPRTAPEAGIAERYALAKAVEHAALAPPGPFQAGGGEQYVFAFTRALNQTNVHPVLKMTILPLTVVLDVVLFPLALLADVMT